MLHTLTYRKKVDKKINGFTIVEMLIIAPIVILVIGTFIYTVVKMTGDVMATRAANTLAYNLQDTLNRIEQDISLSKEFLLATNIIVQSPQGLNNDNSTITGSLNNPPLILNTYTTVGNPLSADRSLVYIKSMPYDCIDTLKVKNIALMSNTVYFIDSSKTLWRRVIMPNSYSTIGCAEPWQKPSCKESYINPTTCRVADIKLLENVSAFTINFYLNQYVLSNPISIPNATSASIKITVDTQAAGRSMSQSGTIRASKLNIGTTQ